MPPKKTGYNRITEETITFQREGSPSFPFAKGISAIASDELEFFLKGEFHMTSNEFSPLQPEEQNVPPVAETPEEPNPSPEDVISQPAAEPVEVPPQPAEMPEVQPPAEEVAEELPPQEVSEISQPVQDAPVATPISEAPPKAQPTEAPVVAEKKSKNGVWIVIAVIAISISLLMGAFALWAVGNSPESLDFNQNLDVDIPQSNTPTFNYRENVTEGDKLTPQEIIAKVSPSVVTISVEIVQGNKVSAGFGTGIIYTDNGYILTNAHVVEGATKIKVTDYNGKTHTAKLVGADTQSDTAVIKISGTDFPAAEFGKSAALVPGDPVIAIGTPYDENLSYTATQGMVSALRKDLSFRELGYTLNLIQHDAPINSGNSGGPLINEYGQVIGINSIKISGTYENLGFALQIDDVIPLAEEIMKTGKVSRPGIGISGYTNEDPKGVYVYTVVPDGPADQAGLEPEDVIIKVNDQNMETIEQLKAILKDCSIGDTLTITYIRGDAVHTAQLTLGELSEQ